MKFKQHSIQNLIVFLALIVLTSFSVSALEYNNETLHADITNFEWCFEEDWTDKALYKENWELYIDNFGCDITEHKIYAVSPAKYTQTDTWTESDCQIKDNKSAIKVNGTYPTYQDCTYIEKSKTYDVTIWEKYDLEKTDYLFTKGSKICVEAKRKASTTIQSCDMNFRFTDPDTGITTDVKDNNKQWWNVTWQNKFQINLSTTDFFPYKLFFNQTQVMSVCNNSGDIRFLNSTEDGELGFNLSEYNSGSNMTVYINDTVSDKMVYMYCNATSPQTSTSEPNLILELANNQLLYLSLDDDDLSGSDPLDLTPNNNDPTNNGADTGVTGKIDEGFDFVSANLDYLDFGSATIRANDQKTICYWINGDSGTNYGRISTSVASSVGFTVGLINTKIFYAHVGKTGNVEYLFTANTGQWYHLCVVTGNTGSNVTLYLDGVNVSSGSVLSQTSDDNLVVGRQGGFYSESQKDEVAIWDRPLTSDKISLIYTNNETGRQYPYYTEPTYNISGALESVLGTQINGSGLLNESFENRSLTVSSGDDFYIFTNFTYLNGTSVNSSNGTCYWSGNNIYDEYKNKTDGVNSTICQSVGCDFNTARSVTFNNVDVTNFIEGNYRFPICHEGTPKDATISTNCTAGDTFLIDKSLISPCTEGYTNIIVDSTACNSSTSVQLNISSSATSPSNALRLVNTESEYTINYNASNEELIYNSTSGLWHTSKLHEYYGNGSRTIDITCNGTGIQDQTDSFNVVVNNVLPEVFLDTISYYPQGVDLVFFSDGISTPFIGTNYINFTSVCSNEDLVSLNISVRLGNGTEIYSNDKDLTGLSGNVFRQAYNLSNALLDINTTYYVNSTCYDEFGSSTAYKSFTTFNTQPVGAWTDGTSLLLSNNLYNMTYSCTDTENEVMKANIYVNDSLNVTQDPYLGWILFNQSVGSYNYTLQCEDFYHNSTNKSIVVTYTQECVITYTGLVSGERYRNLNQTIGTNCSNGINLTGCWISINDYAFESYNCTSDNVTLEVGSNKIELKVGDGFNTTTEFKVFARGTESGVSAFIVLFVLAGMLVFILWFATKRYDALIIHLFVTLIIGLLAYYLLAFSVWVSVLLFIFAGLYFLYQAMR